MEALRAIIGKFSKRECVGVFSTAPVERNSPIAGLDGFCNEALGIETLGGVFTTLIAKGRLIPCQVTEVFSTTSDLQTSLEINVFRGELETLREAQSLGIYKIIEIPEMRAGQPQIIVTFEIMRTRDIFMTARLGSNNLNLKIEKYR